MDEREFEGDLVEDLQEKGVSVHSLGGGTLDLYFEDLGILGEIKRAGMGIITGKPTYKDKRTTSAFTKEQTSLIRKLRRKPIVIAFDDKKDEYFFYEPEQVKKLFEARKELKVVWWGEEAEEKPFEVKLTYEELISTVAGFIASNMEVSQKNIS